MNRSTFSAWLCATTALGFGFSIPALAASDASGMEEVVVTARRVEERLQDVPISITVFNQQQLNNRNITTASDLATYTPSLSTDKRFGPDQTSFSIRGFTQEIRTTPSVGVYFADVVAPRGGAGGTAAGEGAGPGAFFDLQNVQVLKGPQGTLFGRNTTGGAVLVVPQKPTGQFGGYLEGSYGNYDMKRLQGVINVPLGSKARMRFGFDRMTRDGYITNISGVAPSHLADVDYIAARASFVVDVTPDIENYTIGTFSRSDNFGSPPQVFAVNHAGLFGALGVVDAQVARQRAGGFYTVESSIAGPRSLVEQWQVINTTTWHATDLLTIKNIASYGQFKSILRENVLGDNFSYPAALYGTPPLGLGGLPLTVAISDPLPGGLYSNNQQTYTEEVQFQGRSRDDKLTWQVGGYLEFSDPLDKGGAFSQNYVTCLGDPANQQCIDTLGSIIGTGIFGPGGYVPLGGEEKSIGTISYRDRGVYAQGTYAILEKLKLTAGARFTSDVVSSEFGNTVYLFGVPSGGFPPYTSTPFVPHASCLFPGATLGNGCVLRFRKTSDRPTWTVNLKYDITKDANVYVTYSRGYRQGGVSPFSPPGVETYGPETVDTYEVGAKTTFHGRVPGMFNVAAFYNDFSNQQLSAGYLPNVSGIGALLAGAGSSPTIAIINAGKSRIYGVEIESSLQLFRDFRLDMSGSFLDSKLEKISLPPSPPGFIFSPTSEAGRPLAFTSRYKATVTGTYTLPLPDTYGKLSFAATYAFSSGMLTNADSPFGVTDPSNIVNVNLNWLSVANGPVDVSLFATNLFDDKYVTAVSGLFNGYGYEARTVGEPRMFGGRVRLHFGG